MAVNEELLYEMNANGEQILVKSFVNQNKFFLRFTNRTSRPVDIWWRDFEGIKRHKTCIEPGSYYDVKSYLTHPWEFTDASTNEGFVVNNQLIFRAPNHVAHMLHRLNWNISIPVRTLRNTVMLTLATLLPKPEIATRLGLPGMLGRELAELVSTLQSTSSRCCKW